jgi:hypothetical protein
VVLHATGPLARAVAPGRRGIIVNPGGRAPAGRARLTRRGFWLEYASMAWMTVEAAAAVAAGVIASSLALAGFGLDSVIGFAAAVVAWQRRGRGRERRAVRLIGVTSSPWPRTWPSRASAISSARPDPGSRQQGSR